MNNMTLRKWFDNFRAVTAETPESIILSWGPSSWRDDDDELWELPSGVAPFDEIEHLLDIEFDNGFGANESPNLCAWSPSWVLFSTTYDGAEELNWVPRNPNFHDPIRPGGG